MESALIIGYAIFLFVGAVVGAKAGSKISLVMGTASSALILVGYYLTTVNRTAGHALLAILGGALIVVFVKRFHQTKKFMPGGMLAAVSAVFVLYILKQWFL